MKTYFILFTIVLSSLAKFSFADDINQIKHTKNNHTNNKIENENKADDKSSVKDNKLNFIRKYIITTYNPIFKDKTHLLSLFGSYGHNKLYLRVLTARTPIYEYHPWHSGQRDIGNINLSYSRYHNLWEINCRFSFGLNYFFIKQNIDRENESENGILNLNLLGAELVEEIILGHPNLYFTFGLGVSYIFFVDGKAKTNNKYFNQEYNETYSKILPNNSNFNFVIKASIGHRFNNGIILELNWKHYSNGGLNGYNWGINVFGATIGYLF